MIKASDLRSGNFFELEGMGCYPVVDFSCDFTGKLHQVTFLSSINYHRDRVPSETIGTIIPELWQVKPIPLTEEWIQRLGFARHPDDSIPGRRRINGIVEIFETTFAYYLNYPNSKPIVSIHQLQNLYHSLTGEELTLKEIA